MVLPQGSCTCLLVSTWMDFWVDAKERNFWINGLCLCSWFSKAVIPVHTPTGRVWGPPFFPDLPLSLSPSA